MPDVLCAMPTQTLAHVLAVGRAWPPVTAAPVIEIPDIDWVLLASAAKALVRDSCRHVDFIDEHPQISAQSAQSIIWGCGDGNGDDDG